MNHGANANRTQLDRRRRRVLAGALIGLVLLAGLAWLVRDVWLPGRGRATVVAEDADASPTDTSAARSTGTSTSDGSARLGRRGDGSRPERSSAHPTDEATRTSKPPEDVRPPSRDVAKSAATSAEALPEYRADANLTGELTSVGSDTLNNLMLGLATGFGERHPDVRIRVEGKGSSTAPPALTAGIADLGPRAREMNEAEVAAFSAKFGYPPTAIRVAFDALAIYVHKDNPIPHLTLAQADALFGHDTGPRQRVPSVTRLAPTLRRRSRQRNWRLRFVGLPQRRVRTRDRAGRARSSGEASEAWPDNETRGSRPASSRSPSRSGPALAPDDARTPRQGITPARAGVADEASGR